LVVAALRTLLPLLASVNKVEVSMMPATSIRPATRFTADAVVDAMLFIPGAVAYPASARECPSPDSESAPSEVAEPEIVSG
jgi:hypothetical protein